MLAFELFSKNIICLLSLVEPVIAPFKFHLEPEIVSIPSAANFTTCKLKKKILDPICTLVPSCLLK